MFVKILLTGDMGINFLPLSSLSNRKWPKDGSALKRDFKTEKIESRSNIGIIFIERLNINLQITKFYKNVKFILLIGQMSLLLNKFCV